MLPGNRKQLTLVYLPILDNIAREKKKNLTGQMSLFDLIEDGEKEAGIRIDYPKVDEFPKSELLAYEKEILGIYVSGHPLEDYDDLIEENVTDYACSFAIDDETGVPSVTPDKTAIIGGMIASKTIKTTKNNDLMCFFNLEDVTGTVEVIVFPRDYERFKSLLLDDARLFVKGRISVEEDKPAKLVCSEIVPFDSLPSELWIRYESQGKAKADAAEMDAFINAHPGNSRIKIYCEKEKTIKIYPDKLKISASEVILDRLKRKYGSGNVFVKTTSLKKYWNV